MWNIKALAFTVQKLTLLARLKFQREWQNDRMTDRTKTICPPIFDLGGIKMQIVQIKVYILQKSVNFTDKSVRFTDKSVNFTDYSVNFTEV